MKKGTRLDYERVLMSGEASEETYLSWCRNNNLMPEQSEMQLEDILEMVANGILDAIFSNVSRIKGKSQ